MVDLQGVSPNSVDEDLRLSPGLLQLGYAPVRITRSMAMAFGAGLGLSIGESTNKAPVKNGSIGSNGSNGSSSEVLIKKTGKRSIIKGVRSGWSSKKEKDADDAKVSQKSRSTGGRNRGTNQLKTTAGDSGSGNLKLQLNGNDADSVHGGEDVSSGVTEGETTKPSNKAEVVLAKTKSPAVGWVMCDDCRKWRCIPSELADRIEASDIRWTCRENPNKGFSDCSVPQEKTNAEINADLNISEISSSEGDDNEPAVNSKCKVSWTQIRHNIFQHRRPKTLDDDDILVCHCKLPPDGGLGCGDDCLNRMMNVECSPDTCPCGERCSNQQFAKRMYCNVALVRCGKKGFGLRALEFIPKGTFVIEYIGEVLDIQAFELRQKEYARQRQKHFYFMTLNNSEVIDACKKGNLGRFINHSCEPNCQTEKWCVNGEICIGLFAIRDVPQNEEITFNYNFERLYGAAAKKCHCGSSHCHGYIGGDPSNPRDVVHTDSEEDMEPVMLKEEESEYEETVVQESTKICTPPVPPPETVWPPEVLSEPKQPVEVPVPKPKPVAKVKRPKPPTRPKKATPKVKLFIATNKPGGYRSSRYSEVEEKLDKVLNENGGLVKKKDTPKQYLKLLVISTASGDDSKEGTSCSMRDLSLLLDAMLKTTSRSILTEVIQKNGLQLLHNLVKQSRKCYTKIPILRKLMKVLERLAEKEVLKTKHMTSTPPRNGMESFVKSIFELTRHDDVEVQEISRRFQRNWLPNMYDLLAREKSSESSKYWGSDRFPQKRELFRSKPEEVFRSKAEDRPRRPLPFTYNNAGNDHDFQGRNTEQERKRRRRASRWDERPLPLPCAQDPLTSSTPSTSTTRRSASPLPESQQVNASSLTDDTSTQAEPPGYSSNSPNCGKLDQPRCSSQPASHQQQYDHYSSQHQQHQYSRGGGGGEHWNAPPFRPPYRPQQNGNGYVVKNHFQAQGRSSSEAPHRGTYHPGMPQHHPTPKYHQAQHHPPPPLNGCYGRHSGAPSHSQQYQSSMNGYYHHHPPPLPPAHQQQQQQHYHHHYEEEPPVPGL